METCTGLNLIHYKDVFYIHMDKLSGSLKGYLKVYRLIQPSYSAIRFPSVPSGSAWSGS